MSKLEHERDSKVLMDISPTCEGTWLDRGELEAIRRETSSIGYEMAMGTLHIGFSIQIGERQMGTVIAMTVHIHHLQANSFALGVFRMIHLLWEGPRPSPEPNGQIPPQVVK